MVTLEESLTQLVRSETVTADAAWRYAHKRERAGG
jgi:hypothetical protein